MAVPTFQLVLCDKSSGDNIAELTEFTNVSFNVTLGEPSSMSFSVPTASPESSLIVGLAIDVKLYINNVVMFRGRIINPNRTFGDDSSSLSMVAISYKEMLRRRYLVPSDTAVTSGYSASTDVAAIGAALINAAQSKPGGTMDIVTTGYVNTGYSLGSRRYFNAGTSIYDAINSIISSNSGLDTNESVEWDINPILDNNVYEMYGNYSGGVWHSGRGKTEPTYTMQIGTTVLSGSESQDTSKFANVIYVYGRTVNEIQEISATGATSGKFVLEYMGYQTPALAAPGVLAYNASAEAVEFALNKLGSINSQVSVSGGPLNVAPLLVSFGGDLSNKSLTDIGVPSSSVAGATVTVNTYQVGGIFYKSQGSTYYLDSPYGRWESVSIDNELEDQTSVNERAYYLTNLFSTFTPSYTFEIEPSHWNGPDDCWIGDFVNLDLQQEGWQVKRSDLRVTSMRFVVGGDGSYTLSVDVEKPIPADLSLSNLAGRVRVAENMWKHYSNEVRRLEALADADNVRTAKENANIEAAQKAKDIYQRTFPGYDFRA